MGNCLQNSAYAVVAVLAISSGICLCLAQQPPDDVPPPATAPAPLEKPAAEPKVITQADTLAPKVTDKRLREVQFDGTPFDEVINRLRDATGANIVVHWKWFETVGVNGKAPISLRLHDVSLAKVLDEALGQVSSDMNNRLVYVLEDGVITISTDGELNSNVVIRLYDVADLAADGADSNDAAKHAMDEIADLIVNTVDVNTWESAGGTGTIRPDYSRGRLLITTQPEVHRSIVAFLRLLRTPSPQFTIELCLLQLDPAALPADLQQLLPGPDSGEGAAIGEHEKAALLEKAKSAVTAFPSLHAIGGRSARLRAGTDISYIAAPRENSADTHHHEGVVEEGTTITIRPSAPPEGGTSTLAVTYRMARLEKMEQSASVQLPRIAVAQVSATVSVEDGKSVLVAVSLLDSGPKIQSPGDARKRAYLLLTPKRHPPPAAPAEN